MRNRFRLLGCAVVLLALSLPVGITLFVLTVLGLPLIGLMGVGIPLFLGAVWLTRKFADLHRWTFARALDVTCSAPTSAAGPSTARPPPGSGSRSGCCSCCCGGG